MAEHGTTQELFVLALDPEGLVFDVVRHHQFESLLEHVVDHCGEQVPWRVEEFAFHVVALGGEQAAGTADAARAPTRVEEALRATVELLSASRAATPQVELLLQAPTVDDPVSETSQQGSVPAARGHISGGPSSPRDGMLLLPTWAVSESRLEDLGEPSPAVRTRGDIADPVPGWTSDTMGRSWLHQARHLVGLGH